MPVKVSRAKNLNHFEDYHVYFPIAYNRRGNLHTYCYLCLFTIRNQHS